METTLRQAINLFGSLRQLNGHETAVEIDGKNKLLNQPYSFDAKCIWAIAKNLNVLKRQVEVFEAARTSLQEGVGDLNNKDNAEIFQKGIEQMLAEKVILEGITKIKLGGLNLDKNAIQPGIVAELSELIEE